MPPNARVTNTMPDPSGSHSVNVMSSGMASSSRGCPEATSKASNCAVAVRRLRTEPTIVRPSGDQAGAVKNPGENASGTRRVASTRSFLPSASATISALDS